MKPLLKKVLLGVGGTLALVVLGLGGYVFVQTRAFDASMEKVYQTPLPALKRSEDPEVIARGAHLAQSLGGCSGRDCHGEDFSGGKLNADSATGYTWWSGARGHHDRSSNSPR